MGCSPMLGAVKAVLPKKLYGVNFIKKSEYPVQNQQIKNAFLGITEIVINLSVSGPYEKRAHLFFAVTLIAAIFVWIA